MARRMTRRDPIESEIELALSPGLFIRDRACFSFVGGLEGVAAQIDSVLELLVETRETERLAELVHFTTDAVLENISHDATEPAAMKLEKPHPELAARLWRAQAMRIVDAGKSKYYEAAAANLERARKCYLRAGLAPIGRRRCARYGPTTTARPHLWPHLRALLPGPDTSSRPRS